MFWAPGHAPGNAGRNPGADQCVSRASRERKPRTVGGMTSTSRFLRERFGAFADAIGPHEVATVARTIPTLETDALARVLLSGMAGTSSADLDVVDQGRLRTERPRTPLGPDVVPGATFSDYQLRDPTVGDVGATVRHEADHRRHDHHELVQPRYLTVDGVRIRYADGGGAQGPTILLTSPWPESLYAFVPVWETLAAHARLFAVDLPGFGRSERRDDLLSPREMGHFLARLVAEAGLDRPYVVGPDVGTSGGPVRRRRPPRALLRPGRGWRRCASPLQLGEPLASWVLDPDLERFRSIDPHVIVNTAVDNHAGDVPDDIRADYLASYEGDRFVESMRYVRRYPEDLPVLATLLPQITVPVTVITGATTTSCRWPTPTSSPSGCRMRVWSCWTPATSCGRKSRSSTRRPSSAPSPSRLP